MWAPWMLAPEFGALRPWEMGRLKPGELNGVYERARELDKARRRR